MIGITTAIFSPTGTNTGVGFAVPVDTIKRLLPDLLSLGRYRHPGLGIRYAYHLTPGLAEVLKLPVREGLLLVQIYAASPLVEHGIRAAQRQEVSGNQRVYTGGDILVAVDGEPVASVAELETYLETNAQVGETVTLTVVRDGQRLEVPLEVAEEPLNWEAGSGSWRFSRSDDIKYPERNEALAGAPSETHYTAGRIRRGHHMQAL